LSKSMERMLERRKYGTEQYRLRLQMHHPGHQIHERRQRLVELEDQMKTRMDQRILEQRHHLALLSGKLQGLSPLEKISRGFGFVTDEAFRKVESIRQLEPGQLLTVRLADGRVTAQVLKTEILEDVRQEGQDGKNNRTDL
ncbi:MAG: exodeoxyribonuclease VII large subunit, partial [Hungatella sp.]